ncbi:MAG TPA: DegT/DnrJ/EryC1/StrS family aminotransferase, partial [Gemmatimonadaceae bacterium]|nr:DegT/DnrJ/EryC1/StrS family aminotransferase [Gemmatimonadaceae bacterium]
MIGRRQLPVASPIPTSAMLRAWGAMLSPASGVMGAVTRLIAERFQAKTVALTDSGTSALVLALRLAASGGTVALPAFACLDLIAAARYAGVRVQLYDVEPQTLSPDLSSLRRMLAEGRVDAVVVAQLYGFPVDIPGVREVLTPYGIPLIEDAAQQAGATLGGRRTGTFGDLTVLSFGRGKGTTAGNGGALLALSERFRDPVAAVAERLPSPGRGAGDIVGATASWILGRPSVYAIPASIPALHLGETVYHEAHEPESLSLGGATLLRATLA